MKYFYIYNHVQAQFFIERGLPVVGVGKGSRNEIYIKFVRDEEANKVFDEWITRKEK